MVSMKDIANKLNISRCTVSNILNNKFGNKSYKKETIDLVLKTAKEMGYVSNNIAKSLKTGSTGTIAVVVPDIANTFYIRIIKEIERLANDRDYSLIICIAEEKIEKEHKALQMLQSRMVDGVLISPVSYKESLSDTYPFRVVCFDRTVSDNRYCSVLIDNKQSAYMLTNKLLEKANIAPLFLAGSELDYTVVSRLQGYKKALKEKGIEYREENTIYGIYDDESAYKKVCTLIEEQKLNFDSIFLSTNYFIYGVLRAIQENSLSLNSIGGFESFNGSDLLGIKILTVVQPEIEIAKVAFEKLLKLLNSKNVGNTILKTEIN